VIAVRVPAAAEGTRCGWQAAFRRECTIFAHAALPNGSRWITRMRSV